MKRQNKKIYPNVVGGGVAIPLGNNFYFMRGRKHEFGGIDVGPDNKNGLEVEDGEVMQMGGKHVKVYSSLPILNGKSPAQLVMGGANPTKVFNAQERFKDINKLNDDGTRKARYGKRQKAEFGFVGSNNKMDTLGNRILNNNPTAKAVVQLIDPTGITSSNDAYDAVKSFIKDPSMSSFGNAAINVLGAIPGAKYFTGLGKAQKLIKTANAIGDVNAAVNVGTNVVNSEPMRFKLGGTNRHFTINGNVVNKAGYVPSTGELPKANLGTVASIDRHVSKMDKNGTVASILKQEQQRQIDAYKTNKEHKIAEQNRIKTEQNKARRNNLINRGDVSRNPNDITNNTETKEINITNETNIKRRNTFFDREQEISRNPNEYDKVEKNTVKKETNNKTEKVENKDKTNTNILNFNSLYPNRYGDVTTTAENVNKTVNKVKDDIKGLIGFGKNAFFRTYNKIVKPEEKESSGINYEKISKPTIEEVNDATINDVSAENNVENIIPSYTKIPNIILGDVIQHPKNKGQYMIPENIDLGSVTVGIRHRGDYSDIDTEGAITTHMSEFKPWTYVDGVDLNKGYIGVDKNGKVKVGNYYDFDENYMINRAAMNKTKGFVLDDNGNILFENDKGKPASKKWSPALDRALIEYQKDDGTWGIGPSNITAYEGTNNFKTYGAMTGGRMIIRVGDETRLVSGSVKDINNAIQDMKNRHGVEFVEAYSLDNGTYNHAIRTKNKKITKDDWIEYDNRNSGGGHVLYLKRLGGMSKRQKAEVGKNIFSPRGLGIQASMTKMQADAWDKKHPGEDNPFAQIFIDNFGDPTVYSSIMSDDANARGFGIDRGYRGNGGLGWAMPELPSINLNNYFDAQGDPIVRADRGGSAGGGVSGGKRTETKIESSGLNLTEIKPKGIVVDPVKPETQLTVKIPETEVKTKNKGTWWKNNGSDLISGLAKGGASLASYLINKNMLNDLKYTGQPIFTPAAKLKTKVNINPQIDAINRTTAAKNANVSANTASSKVRNIRMNNNYIDRLGYLNELYGMKENKETELINADKLNQQEITKGNIQAYNDWTEKKQNFDNTVREKQSENAVSFVSNLASGVDDILANRQKRKQFKQNVAAYMASHPNVSPELLESYGLDIFGDSKKIDKSDKVVKSEIKVNVPSTNTKIKENEEYLKWLEKNNPEEYKNYIKKKVEMDEKTKKLIRERNLAEYQKLTQR